VPCARLIKQAAGLLRTRFIPHDTRWQAARRGLLLVGLDRFLYIYLLYVATYPQYIGEVEWEYTTNSRDLPKKKNKPVSVQSTKFVYDFAFLLSRH
jgi:hypothetical protein